MDLFRYGVCTGSICHSECYIINTQSRKDMHRIWDRRCSAIAKIPLPCQWCDRLVRKTEFKPVGTVCLWIEPGYWGEYIDIIWTNHRITTPVIISDQCNSKITCISIVM